MTGFAGLGRTTSQIEVEEVTLSETEDNIVEDVTEKICMKTLTQLIKAELASQMTTLGVSSPDESLCEREAVLLLTTFLIDKGEDPTSYRFTVSGDSSDKTGTDDKQLGRKLELEDIEKRKTLRRRLVARIVKLER